MKKLLPLLLCLLLTGCAPIPTNGPAVEAFAPAPSDSDRVSLGLAATAHIQKSMHATENSPGRVHLELTVAAVLVDEGGVIRQCAIDGVRAVVPFDRWGAPLLHVGTHFPSKCALGEDYGMARASSLGQEWHTQAAALAASCIGKTPADLQQGDVTASVTIATDDALRVVAQAAENAAACDARAGDTLQLRCIGALTDAAPATAETNGLVSLRGVAAAHVLRAGAAVVTQDCALTAQVPLTAGGEVACPLHVGLSLLSDVLYPVAVTEDDRALLAESGG